MDDPPQVPDNECCYSRVLWTRRHLFCIARATTTLSGIQMQSTRKANEKATPTDNTHKSIS